MAKGRAKKAGKKKRENGKEKEKLPFRYSTRTQPDPYNSLLSNIRQRAHTEQVNALLDNLKAAKRYAEGVRKETLAEVYGDARPMDVEDPPRGAPPPPAPQIPSGGIPAALAADRRRTPMVIDPNSVQGSIRELAKYSQRIRPTPTAMDVDRPTFTAQPVAFTSEGPAQLGFTTLTNQRLDILRQLKARTGGQGDVPSKREILEHGTATAAASYHYPGFDRMTTGYTFRPVGRDFKAPRLSNPVPNSGGYMSYLEDRDHRIRGHKGATPMDN